jgi:hypothetical protein
MKILIIGSGAWPTKIFNGLYSKSNKDKVKQISAGEFLSQDSPNYGIFDCVWIATTPENQIKILEKFSHSSSKIILEKPLFTTQFEENEFARVLRGHKSLIQMSTIWLYSSLWKNLEVSLENIKSISIKHKYANRRAYCHPIFDWIPHDMYLLNNLGLDIQLSNESSITHLPTGGSHLKFGLSSKVSIKMDFTEAKIQDFSWDIECVDSSRLFLSFTNRTLQKIDQKENLTFRFNELNSNPAKEMLNSFSNATKSNLPNFINSHSFMVSLLSSANFFNEHR